MGNSASNHLDEIKSTITSGKYDSYELFHEFLKVYSKTNPLKTIVASIGKQSLGKSMLLNSLFKTKFATKEGYGQGKCTVNLNSEELEDFVLLDVEGLMSSSSSPAREHLNLSLSLSFSSIVLLNLKHEQICDDASFLKPFSFSYWLAIKKLKLNSQKRPKIIIMLRDPQTNSSLSENEIYKSLEKDILKFADGINQKIVEYNNYLKRIIEKDSSLPNKESLYDTIIPCEEFYKFQYEFIQPIVFNKPNYQFSKIYTRTEDIICESNFFECFNKLKQECANELSNRENNFANPISNVYGTDANFEIIQKNNNLLLVAFEKIKNCTGVVLLRDQLLFMYYLSIDVDWHYLCSSFDEFEGLVDSATGTLEKIIHKDKKLNYKNYSSDQINFIENKKNHCIMMNKKLQPIKTIGIREKSLKP